MGSALTELRCFTMSQVIINFVSLGIMVMGFVVLLILYIKK